MIADFALIPIFLASAATGIGLHVSGHGSPHEVWENWAMAHVISSVLFLGFGIYHVCNHWAWYKSLFSKGLGNKSMVTLLLTVVFLLLFVSGVVLLAVIDSPNSTVGHLHYLFGLVIIILSLWHIIKRLPLLKKMIDSR